LNVWAPVISISGRTVIPVASIGHTKYEMPWRCGTWGFVRAMRMPYVANCASDVQTFWPVTTHSSPSRSARVVREARSDPAPGSLNSWHHISSPDSSRGR
jgi:hypothetical protein